MNRVLAHGHGVPRPQKQRAWYGARTSQRGAHDLRKGARGATTRYQN
jgi:hypothetical protein